MNVESVSEPGSNPTVGLLQNRFSSTVHDYYDYGPKDSLERIGCDWPDFSNANWASGGGDNVTWMQDVHCNIALGAWYYYYNATGNGSPPVWISDYCRGDGSSAVLVIGLLSHLEGGSGFGYDPSNPFVSRDNYIADIKSWFDDMIQPSPDPHPFLVDLNPNVDQYCD